MANRRDERRTTNNRATGRRRTERSQTAQSHSAQSHSAQSQTAQSRSDVQRRTSARTAQRQRKKPQGVIPVAKAALTALGYKMLRSPLVPIIGGLVLLCALLIGVVWALTNKNAVEVYVNDQVVATVPMGKTITAEWFYDHAIAKLETELGTRVRLEEKVTIKPVHLSKKKQSHVDYAISEVYKKFQAAEYKVEAAEILVNSIPICIVKNKAAADEVQERLLTAYGNDDTVYVSKNFVEDVKTNMLFVSTDEISTAEQAYAKLTIQQEMEITYTVKKNDSRWKICNDYGITEARLMELNPTLPAGSGLGVGDTLRLVVPTPLISVETVVETTYTDVEPKTTEKRENSERQRGWSAMLQEGKDGQKLVTVHVTYLNGVETSRQEIPEKTVITVPPLLEIIEVGTL